MPKFILAIVLFFLPHLAFKDLAYSMNDDFMMNLLYSGRFTGGKAINETLFQHDFFVSFLVHLNNTISNTINWYYYIHYLFIWIPIILYIGRLIPINKFGDYLNFKLLIIIFVGIWVTREFTFTWISSLNGILSWLWFWNTGKKTHIDWLIIAFLVLVSILVRPPSFVLITIIALIIKLAEYLMARQYGWHNIKRFAISNVLPVVSILFLFYLFVTGHINPENKNKFPFSWVSEEQYLTTAILSLGHPIYDQVDLQMSKHFYFDDRFDGVSSSLNQLTAIKVSLSGSYLKNMVYRFIKKTIKIIFRSKELLILILFLFMIGKNLTNKKAIILSTIIVFFMFTCLNVLLNVPVLKPRVLIPPLIFVFLYFLKHTDAQKSNKIKVASYVFTMIILVYTLFYALQSQRNLSASNNKMYQVKEQRSQVPDLLFLDGGLEIWVNFFNLSRSKIIQLDGTMLPGGWGMRSSTFDSILKSRGFSNLDEAYKSGKLAFLCISKELPEPWDNYFEKYYRGYAQIANPVTLMGKRVYAVTLSKIK